MWKNVSIRCRDSNPRPFEHESSPITTRPGLPPNFPFLVRHLFVFYSGPTNVVISALFQTTDSLFFPMHLLVVDPFLFKILASCVAQEA